MNDIKKSPIIKLDRFDRVLVINEALAYTLLKNGWIEKTDVEGEYLPTKDFQFFYDGAMGL